MSLILHCDIALIFQAPVRANVKKGLLTSLKGALDDKRFHYHKVINPKDSSGFIVKHSSDFTHAFLIFKVKFFQ